MIYNSRIFEFNKSVMPELPSSITHLRGFGWDFGKIQSNGLPSRPNASRVQDWIDYVLENDLKVVWTMLASNNYDIQNEINYLNAIIDKGVKVDYIQIGGEYWLGKYYTGDVADPKVIEKITIDDYINILDNVLPTLKAAYPDVKLTVLGCSHDIPQHQTDQIIQQFDADGRKLSAIKRASHYRPIWNDTVAKYVVNNPQYDLGMTVHYYAGAKPNAQPINGEEAIFEGINWEPFIGQIRGIKADMFIIVPEAGWYPSNYSEEQLDMMIEFYESGVEAIGEHGLMGLHVLNQAGVGDLNLVSSAGITVIGEHMLDYFHKISTPEPEEPYLINVMPDKMYVYWGRQTLYFSDGTKRRYTVWRGEYKFSKEDVGLTLSECLERFNLS